MILERTKRKERGSANKKPAYNGRFCESGGVCPPEYLCKFASASPAQTFVKPPPSQSRWDVTCKRRTAQRESTKE